jgi:hypothetical protein
MHPLVTPVLALTGCLVLALPLSAQQLSEPFRQVYTGDDATGKHVRALWQFDGDTPGKDMSGKGSDLTLRGAQFVSGGLFGGGLESFCGWPVEDKPHYASARNNPALCPTGAFSVELWIKPKPEIKGYPEAFLLDKKYVDNTDYQLTLGPADGAEARAILMRLGFGADTATCASLPVKFPPDQWRHIAFTYDGNGTGCFYVDGGAAGSTYLPGRKGIAPGKKDLVLGDRIGSYFHGFPGIIDQVRLCDGVLEFRPLVLSLTSLRKTFVRMEPGAELTFAVKNLQRLPVKDASVTLTLGNFAPQKRTLVEIAPGAVETVSYALDTSLRPDTYKLAAEVDVPGDTPLHSRDEFTLTLVPRPMPHTMPVVMWGAGLGEVDRLKDIGFTHAIGVPIDVAAVWDAGKPIVSGKPEDRAKVFADLDRALATGISAVASLSPGSWARSKTEVQRIDRQGKPIARPDVCASLPQVRDFCYNVGASMAQTYGSHPGLTTALIHTEVRSDSAPCFHESDREAFRKFAGYDIPAEAGGRWGVKYTEVKDFPADRVIPDNYPLYVYYKWLWKQGDGWNDLHSAVDAGLKSTGRKDLWTFHDPAVRVQSVYGSGGNVDVLSHWTYSYPDPIRIGLCTDELFCMAQGASRPDQQVMKMTQIIWYRSQTAPEPGEQAQAQTATFNDQDTRPTGTGRVDAQGRYQASWEREIPDARFITIAPMHLREAFWTKMARPIQGIMYHGWQSLVPVEGSTSSYRYTHPETKNELRRLVKSVVEPLGPALMQVPDRPSDVAFLESFASQNFAQRGTYGWNGGWAGDAYLILMYAQLQPKIVYDETVQKDGLDAYKILVAVDCDVLTRSVVDKIKAFQAQGGLLIGDENLCPALKPDLLLPRHDRPKEADKGRGLNLQAAADLRKALDARYSRHADSSTPDVVTRVRQYGTTDYLFAVNDLREFGDYVGHHGLVMENGLPTSSTLTLARGGHVYDLVARREVTTRLADGNLTIAADFGPCEGRVYMVTSQALSAVSVEAPSEAKPGDEVTFKAAVLGEDGKPLDAVVPVRIDILDPHGRAAEFSGYYGAKDGQVQVTAKLAPNDVPGLWRVHVEELASGLTRDAYMRVNR